MKKIKGMQLSAVLAVMLMINIVFIPIVSAQENQLTSNELAQNYQSKKWDTVELITSSNTGEMIDEIFFLKKGDTVKYLEITNKGGTLQTKELIPSLINSTRNEELINEQNIIQDKYPGQVVQTVRITEEDHYIIEGITASVKTKHASNTIQAKNILGIVMYSLTASGFFHYNPGVEVTFVTSVSSAYANILSGWTVDSFSSSASWNTQIGTVYANAQFEHLISDDVSGWSQIQVDKDGTIYQSGAFN